MGKSLSTLYSVTHIFYLLKNKLAFPKNSYFLRYTHFITPGFGGEKLKNYIYFSSHFHSSVQLPNGGWHSRGSIEVLSSEH